MHGSFVEFSKTGNPGIVDGIRWKKYSENDKFTLLFNDKCSYITNPYEKNYNVWKNINLYNHE